MDHAYWLSLETARPRAEELVDEVRTEISDRTSKEYLVKHEGLAQVLVTRSAASIAMQSSWFFVSIGIVDHNDHSKETYYLSVSPHAYYFADHNILPWTNWLGDLVTRVRDALQNGACPTEIEYGPPNRRLKLPLGPLVEYEFQNGRLLRCDFKLGVVTAQTEDVESVPVETPVDQAPTFGLKEIIRTIDIDQNDRIRGPKSGIFVLMGGPGVGKTTVAIHRIPFLVNEQLGYDENGRRANVSPEDLFFKQSNMLVVVWKTHLVPYLRMCIEHLGMNEFPDENVIHVDDWIERNLRRYVRIGPSKGAVKIRPEPENVSDAKLRLTESDIDEFLASGFPLKTKSAHNVATTVQSIRNTIEESGKSTFLGFDSTRYDFTVSGIAAVGKELLRQIPEPERFGKYSASVDRELRERIERMISEETEHATQYIDILWEFYRSELVADRLRSEYDNTFVNEFLERIKVQEESRVITRSDMYLLLWIVHLVTADARSRIAKERPLPTYSHVLIDEAQYYHPVVLRLFAELCQLPDGTMTIVGDLEQKITSRGGLARWDDIDLDVPPENVQRLVTNYRWSRNVFEFLMIFRDASGIKEELNRPKAWYSGEGSKPIVAKCDTRESELDWVADSIARLRDAEESELWTVAVVAPESQHHTAKEDLVDRLTSYGVHARWADGEDVKESVDRVIVTDFDSIVGLEFDAIYVIAIDDALPDLAVDKVRPVWVALTRARKFLHVSRLGSDAIFDSEEFAPYRQ